MNSLSHNQLLREEFDQYYANFDSACERLLEGLEQTILGHPEDSNYGKKSRMHEYLCQECPVKIFRHTPLFFEISSGRGRHTWGGLQSKVGRYFQHSTAHLWLIPYDQVVEEDKKEGILHCYSPVSFDHHCPGYDNLLRNGLNGIIHQAEDALNCCTDSGKKEFYRCVIRSNKALIRLAERFSEEAARLAMEATDEEEKNHYQTVAAAARWIPANPPRTFYEALNFIIFYRECVASIEGIGFSILGHLDRLLYPFYEADLAAGRITPEKAKELIGDLLTYTDIRFDAAHAYFETSTTIELGGCDETGKTVYNKLTDLILQTVIDLRAISTKINCRISKAHPQAYLEKIASVQLAQLPCIMMHNDDVLIPARVKQGQDIADARLYVGGGCHEVVLANTEVSSRADTWINMPQLFLRTLHIHPYCRSFEELYEAFLEDTRCYCDHIAKLKNEAEAHWCEYDPLPLYSSSLTGCLESGKDATEGGNKYCTVSLSFVGAATVIDSIYSVKHLVFDEKMLSLSQLIQILDNDFSGNEPLRQYIVHKIPKHGTNHDLINEFSEKVLADLSKMAGQPNARGGKYIPAFYPHDRYRDMGNNMGATPDGRHAHTPMSRGVSPSEFIDTDSPLDMIHSLKHIDFTKYADSFITEITLPQMDQNEKNLQILVTIIQAFLDAEGSSLQFNLLNRDLLLEAKRNPQQHTNLLVRVCGYSAAFIYLKEETQDEIINRAIR